MPQVLRLKLESRNLGSLPIKVRSKGRAIIIRGVTAVSAPVARPLGWQHGGIRGGGRLGRARSNRASPMAAPPRAFWQHASDHEACELWICCFVSDARGVVCPYMELDTRLASESIAFFSFGLRFDNADAGDPWVTKAARWVALRRPRTHFFCRIHLNEHETGRFLNRCRFPVPGSRRH